MKKALVIFLILACIFILVFCSGKSIIVSIRDQVEENGDATVSAIEYFYTDDTTEYYFYTMRSHAVIVTYLNGDSEDIVTALKAGRATIADLDRFGIKYGTQPKK